MSIFPIRLLIVEDDQRISELHRRFVEKLEGFEVVGVANTIAEGDEMVELLGPDLILLDLFFPEGSGMDLLRRMRAGAAPSDVILITAAREIGALQEALRGGVFDYLVKPVYFNRFQEALLKYRDYFERMQQGGRLEQKDIDQLFHAHPALEETPRSLPKGIDPLTLKKIRQIFEDPAVADLSAEEAGKRVGVSRITARRYLEFLIGEGVLAADLIYGVVGRPERRYFRKS
ncbi:transcriptional regulatory protein [Desulfuromonas versatilis]|uniref:Transcriptional regulatory protein n=1 Tax=Desulfuromonas versatilis TaxID=2802975 RepID=A0ABM8HV16_9BACT|nr:response regulator [Desulfuromonas versatilis]BCR04353.1 transcriptional regulatory protein [Desulfuromonas versatilis]